MKLLMAANPSFGKKVAEITNDVLVVVLAVSLRLVGRQPGP